MVPLLDPCRFESRKTREMEILPNRIIAHENIQQLLAAEPDDSGSKRRTIISHRKPLKVTSTKPPIVWFPGEPDCNETAPSSKKKHTSF